MKSERIERAVAAISLLVAGALHLLFFHSAGALWRDELATYRLAHAPSLPWFLERWQFEAFGIIVPATFRAWFEVAGGSISVARVAGLLIGLGLFACVYVVGRCCFTVMPLFALAVTATSVAVVRYGDSVRGYGLGAMAALLTFGAFFVAVNSGERASWALAGIAALAAVHTSYHNAVLVFACGVAAAAVLWARGQHRLIVLPFAIGAVAAASLLLYAPIVAGRSSWRELEAFDVSPVLYARRFVETLSLNGNLAAGFFLLTILLASGLLVRSVVRSLRSGSADVSLIYVGVAGALFAAGHAIFIRVIGYFPQPWYYLVSVIVLAICVDVVGTRMGAVRSLLAVVMLAISLPSATTLIAQRQTNADEVARFVAITSRPGDLIVVYPWYCGVSFAEYYRGRTSWVSLPPLGDFSMHRYDQVLAAMRRPNAAREVAVRAVSVLNTGHSVWLVGFPLYSDRAAYANPRHLSTIERADFQWCRTLEDALRQNRHRSRLMLAPASDVSRYERMGVVVIR